MIRTLIVDDSALVRQVISTELAKFPDIEVVGTAVDPFVAREKIARLRPDVVTLDIEMPRMDGLTFLEKLMRYHPTPVVIVSSLAAENSDNAIRALALGAIEIVRKPTSQFSAPDVAGELVKAIRTAALSKVVSIKHQPRRSQQKTEINGFETTHKIIAIGASTGGVTAIERVLTKFPEGSPGVVIVQHMPLGFSTSFARRLNDLCRIEVREARNGDSVVPGTALLAPGGQHMELRRSGANYCVGLLDGPPVHFQKPAVDLLFESVARTAGANAVGIILTGMGRDGAKGMLQMKHSGARTIAQDEASCIVFGMPKEAIAVGGVDEVLALDDIPAALFGKGEPPAEQNSSISLRGQDRRRPRYSAA